MTNDSDKDREKRLKGVHDLKTADDARRHYDDWADKYDADLIDSYGYCSPRIGADAFVERVTDRNCRVMDLGCGTGHVGPEHVSRMIRVVKPGGPVVFYLNAVPYKDMDFSATFSTMEKNNEWMVEHTEESNYMDRIERPGVLVVAHRIP